MHPYVLISLLSSLAAGMLAAAIWARDARNRGNQLAALLLTATSFWSFCDVLFNLSTNAEVALGFVRLSCFGSILIPPLAFHMLLTLEPLLYKRYGRYLRLSYALGIAFATLAATTNANWTAAHPTSWGWSAESNWGVGVGWIILIPFPIAALVDWYRYSHSEHRLDTWLGIAVGIPALIATLTDFVLPLLDIPFPRFGSASLAAWGAVALWKVYRFRDPILAPHLFAREILATLPDGVALLRLDGTIRAVNEKMAALAGSTATDLMGRPVSELLVEASEATGHDHEGRERRLLRPSGESIAVVVDETALFDDEGNQLGQALVVRDLREVVALRSRLITSGRLAAVGQLAAGIAHEINNPIAYVQSDLNLMREHWETVTAELEKGAQDPKIAQTLKEGAEMIAESCEGLERVAAIVRDVGGFSPTAKAQWEDAEIGSLLDMAVRVAHPQLRDRATVEREYGEVPLIRCVAQELMQVFLNLMLNAAQALEGSGRIRLRTARDGDHVDLWVSDDGKGMGPETLERIFTPFFTTKPVGVGTGLGLAISRQIVEKHGGAIDVESAPGEGTTFHIRLPLRGVDGHPRHGAPER